MKRLFDIVAALLLIVVLSPVFAVVALVLVPSGPVFLRRRRIGRDCTKFDLLTFRIPGRPSSDEPANWHTSPESRLGRFLVNAAIDDLPGLFNVLKGEMSLAGPRPIPVVYRDQVKETATELFKYRPGLIDYACLQRPEDKDHLRTSANPERTYLDEVLPRHVELNLNYMRRVRHTDMRLLLAWLVIHIQSAVGRFGRVSQVSMDAVVAALAFGAAYQIRFDGNVPPQFFKQMVLLLPYTILARVGVNLIFGLYRVIWRYVSLYDAWRFAKAIGVVTIVFLAFRLGCRGTNPYLKVPLSIIFLEGLFSFSGMIGLRILRRWLYETAPHATPSTMGSVSGVLVIGAGDSARHVAREVRLRRQLNMRLVGFVDDDTGKAGMEIEGVKVYGTLDQIGELHRRLGFQEALLAISDLPFSKKRGVVHVCGELGVKLRVLPGTSDLISGNAEIAPVRDVRIEDLLGREVQNLASDDPMLQPVYGGKRILITGAGGSIGSELCRQLCSLGPGELILVEKDENNLFVIDGALRRRFPDIKITGAILDVQDRRRLNALFAQTRPQVVLHAAAYKHVPLMELNPSAAIENNVAGTLNVVEAVGDHRVETFVMLSTDKAVNPTSVMGATKRVAELIVRQAQERYPATRFASVRFGNVLGSRGSVIPTFREQIARGGPVTVTHSDVVRYFMTIPEASQLVLKAGTLGDRGEVFVLDMGQPIKIVDLARDMIRLSGFNTAEIPIQFVGLRPGEKLFEELLLDRDSVVPTQVDKVFVSRPELRQFDDFSEGLAVLIAESANGDLERIRGLLERLDIGLRAPDTGGG